MVLVAFFVMNLNPINASLKGIFVNSISRLIMIFQLMELGEQVYKAHLPAQQASNLWLRYPASESESRTLKRCESILRHFQLIFSLC